MSYVPLSQLVALKDTQVLVSEVGSGSTTTTGDMDSISEESGQDRLSVDVAMVPQLPPVKFHDGPLQFLSKASIGQREYERMIVALG